jgi:hypothetical protein
MQRLVNTVLQKLPWNVRWEGLFCDQTVSDDNWTEFLFLQIRTFKTTEKTKNLQLVLKVWNRNSKRDRNYYLVQWFATYGSRTPRKNISNGVFSCLHNLHDKTIRNLVSFATAYVSEQSTFSLLFVTRKTTMLNVSYVPCIIFVGGSRGYKIYYH